MPPRLTEAMEENRNSVQLRPLVSPPRALMALSSAAGIASAGWLYSCVRLMAGGHQMLATESYGAAWGITVANIIHVIGISHVGIAVSATVRVLKLETYRNVARLAELMTLVALVTALLNIAVDVGRPDRFLLQTVLYGQWRAPMVWSMTVIAAYFLVTGVYLYLSLRRDLAILAGMHIPRRGLYRFLALGYQDTPEERRRHRQTLFWVALLLVPIMVAVHSVYGLFFGLLSARPGWFNPLQAPYFVLGAVVSGFSALIVVTALVRRAYGWQELLSDRVFRVSGIFLAFVVFLYLYFLLSEHLTAQYAGPAGERAVSDSLLFGSYAPMFWSTTIGGLLIPFMVLLVSAVRPSTNVFAIVVSALSVNLAMWAKRLLLVVPPQYQTHLPGPRPLVEYGPTGIELAVTLGSYAFAILVFLGLLRLVPLVELRSATEALERPVQSRRSLRTVVIFTTLLIGAALIVWGVTSREHDYAPVKWLTGIILLAAIPLESCLIHDLSPPAKAGEPERGAAT